MSKLTEKIGEKINFYRKKKKVTQEELAKLSGLKCKQSISNYERGNYAMTINNLNNVAKALKVKLEDLLP
jgi:transcriptional regulator with XRE-family HTH domain